MEKISEQILFEGRWLSIKESTFKNCKSQIFKWESVVRKRNASSVVMIAKLVPSERFILIKQYRPAVQAHVLGFPAGLDNHSDQQIIEELRQETGYTGTIKATSPIIKPGAGIINDSSRVVYMHVDESLKVNQSSVQDLECSEEIEVFLLKISEIKKFLVESADQGVAISAGLWYSFMVRDWIQGD